MYNEERKQRYIQEKTQQIIINPYFLPELFNKISPVEQEKRKDIADFSNYDIKDCYKYLSLTSLDSLRNINSQLSTYTIWCIQQNLVADNQNHFAEMGDAIFQSCLNKFLLTKKIVSREMVVDWARQLLNAQDSFILLALFEFGRGKQWSDILQAKITDISGNTMKLASGRTVQISTELKKYAIQASQATVYYRYGDEKEDKQMIFQTSEYIVKDKWNAVHTDLHHRARVMVFTMMRILKYLGIDAYVTNGGIIESGKVHMVRERSAFYNMTPAEYIYSGHRHEVENQYNCVITRTQFMTKYGDLL